MMLVVLLEAGLVEEAPGSHWRGVLAKLPRSSLLPFLYSSGPPTRHLISAVTVLGLEAMADCLLSGRWVVVLASSVMQAGALQLGRLDWEVFHLVSILQSS
jgi:hypothetical protein